VQPGQLGPQPPQFGERQFRSNIADERVLSKRTTAESADGHVEAPATGIPGCRNFCRSIVRARMQMNTDLDPRVDRAESGTNNIGNLLWSGEADRIRQRNLRDAGVREQIAGRDDLVDAPRISIRIAKSHRDVGNDSETGLKSRLTDSLQRLQRFFGGLVLIATEKLRRDGIRKPSVATASVSTARAAPFELTTMPMISTSSGGSRKARTCSASAICGTAWGETKETASIWRKPAATRVRR